ncbi:MAG: VWA domain-containing protein [Clostridia bacterium]|nr:VWA domain-containing protein [Clostridia bacterium]
MKNNLTELVFILDRSGSMHGLEADTIGGYNGLLEKQKAEPGEATVTTVLFDDRYELLCENADIQKIGPITEREYYARGCTALLDAVGRTIDKVGQRHKFAPAFAKPSKTMVVIITDGHENASREFGLSKVKSMIEHQKEKYGWEFLFLGANIDAVQAASDIGISQDRAVEYHADSVGTAMNFDAVDRVTRCVRARAPISADWKKDITEHLKKRR